MNMGICAAYNTNCSQPCREAKCAQNFTSTTTAREWQRTVQQSQQVQSAVACLHAARKGSESRGARSGPTWLCLQCRHNRVEESYTAVHGFAKRLQILRDASRRPFAGASRRLDKWKLNRDVTSQRKTSTSWCCCSDSATWRMSRAAT